MDHHENWWSEPWEITHTTINFANAHACLEFLAVLVDQLLLLFSCFCQYNRVKCESECDSRLQFMNNFAVLIPILDTAWFPFPVWNSMWLLYQEIETCCLNTMHKFLYRETLKLSEYSMCLFFFFVQHVQCYCYLPIICFQYMKLHQTRMLFFPVNNIVYKLWIVLLQMFIASSLQSG